MRKRPGTAYASCGPGWWKITLFVGIVFGFAGGLNGFVFADFAASAAAFAAFNFSSSGSCGTKGKRVKERGGGSRRNSGAKERAEEQV